jgi:diadenosine tetraphosphate (Ap4A) HIT family hydrolase
MTGSKTAVEQRSLTIGAPMEDCIFCDMLKARRRPLLAENMHFFVVPDEFPVNRGHMLVLPKRHTTTLFDLTGQEMLALGEILRALQERLQQEFHPDGYNIGVNEGKAAGQTIPHLHIHVIPRFSGDVDEPRGGIRNIKKPLVPY